MHAARPGLVGLGDARVCCLLLCGHLSGTFFSLGTQDTKQLELKGLMMASYQLRQRMLHFMQNLVYYMMVEARLTAHFLFCCFVFREGAGGRGDGGGAGYVVPCPEK